MTNPLDELLKKQVYIDGERVGTLLDIKLDSQWDGWQTIKATIVLDDESLDTIEALVGNQPIRQETQNNGVVSDADQNTYATYQQNAKVQYVRNGRIVGGAQTIPAGKHESE